MRILLREKDIPFESHPVNLATEQHVSRWFLGINPRGVVPVLVHDGVVHVESNDILEYVDASLPSQAEPFFPRNEEERRVVKESLALEDELHMDLRTLTMGFLFPRRAVTRSEKTLQRWEREGVEDPMRAKEVEWWRRFAAEGVSPERARAAVDAHRRAFDRLEERLERSPWLIGGRISVLEIAWFITTRRLEAAGYPLEQHPKLERWHRALAARPAFAEEASDPLPLRLVARAYRGLRRLQGTTLRDVCT